ncbi:MAG: hypothetical protein OHK93_004925 [Ramalina farinacea]|uniref:Uncharacterized protein n=1 Tax=Ramalina farinacea TaxID=258253 RepID=A0AA43QV29_9LECA|nr:hypothetical protein [Ramalina farinacea]
MSYNRSSDWDSSGAYHHFNLEQGQQHRGANGQWYAHDGRPIDESAPRTDRYPLETNRDARGSDASGRNASIRMQPERTYRVGGQIDARDGWPIDDEPRNTTPASTRRSEPTSRGGQAQHSSRQRSPSSEDRYVTPRGPADEGWVPPGVEFPPRPRYYDDDPDDYSRPAPSSQYPYQDNYNHGRSNRSRYDQDYPSRRSLTANDYGGRSSTYRSDDYDRDYRSSNGRRDGYGYDSIWGRVFR